MSLLSRLTLVFFLSSSAFADAKPIQIAVLGPFSGPYAAYGTQILSGVSQAAQDINNNDSLHGVKIEINPIDDQCNPDLALKQAAKIIKSKKYQAVIGHMCSSCALATNKLYAQANILVITPSATNPKITQQHIATIFRMTANDEQQSYSAAEFIANKLHSEKIAIVHDEELYSKDLADLCSEKLLQLGKSPVLYQAIPRGTKNFVALANKLKMLKADAIYFAGLYPEVATLAQTLKALQIEVPLISADAIAINKFVSSAGGPNVTDNVILTFAGDPKKLLSSRKTIARMQKNQLETNGYALYAYAAVETIAEAILKTNSTDSKILANWLHHNVVNTVLGAKSWDTNGDIVDGEYQVYTWRGSDYNAL